MKAMTCSRFTVGNPARKLSMESPACRQSSSVWPGTRVPAKQGVPPITSASTLMIFRFFTLQLYVEPPSKTTQGTWWYWCGFGFENSAAWILEERLRQRQHCRVCASLRLRRTRLRPTLGLGSQSAKTAKDRRREHEVPQLECDTTTKEKLPNLPNLPKYTNAFSPDVPRSKHETSLM